MLGSARAHRPVGTVWVLVALIAALAATTTQAARPPIVSGNDAFSGAAAISGEEGQVDASNVGATREAGEPAHAGGTGGASVWLRWTAPRDAQFAFSTDGSDFDTVLAVYAGAAVDALASVRADDDSGPGPTSELSFHAVAGTVYHVAVDGFQGKAGRVQLSWAPAAANDNFADARTIAGRAGKVASPTPIATKEAGEPRATEFSEPDRSVWFRWTAPADMRVGFDVRSSPGTVTAYSGASLGGLTPLAGGRFAVFAATAGVTYQIAVDEALHGAVLLWQPSPPNDEFDQATTIVGRSGRARGSNFPASRELGEPDHGSRAETSIWYRWQAPRTGVLRVSTAGSDYDTVMAAYRGARLQFLRLLARDDDGGPGLTSAVRLRVRRGRVYRIVVDGYRGAMGDVVLRWALSPRERASRRRAGTVAGDGPPRPPVARPA